MQSAVLATNYESVTSYQETCDCILAVIFRSHDTHWFNHFDSVSNKVTLKCLFIVSLGSTVARNVMSVQDT